MLCVEFQVYYKLRLGQMGKFQKFLDYKYNYLKIVHYDVQINSDVEESLMDYLEAYVSSLDNIRS